MTAHQVLADLAASRPWRDGSIELALYGDDDARIPDPTPAQRTDALVRLARALRELTDADA